MLPDRLERLAVLVGEETTEEQVPPVPDVRLWYQLPDQLAMVSVAELCVTLLAVSVSLSGATAVEAADSALKPVAFSARTLYW